MNAAHTRIALYLLTLFALSACGGGDSGNSTPAGYTVSGTVSGAIGKLTLQNNGGDTLTLPGDGELSFPTGLADNSTYNITIVSQPDNQICTVGNGNGKLTGKSVENVKVVCIPMQKCQDKTGADKEKKSCPDSVYTLGGTVSGLTGTVMLHNNGGDALTLTANGTFNFTTPLADLSGYNVTVATQPDNQMCAVSYGSGTLAGANVTNVAVACVSSGSTTYTVGGTVSGLTGTVVLHNNGGDALTLSANGAFNFTTPLADLSGYNVTVVAQPDNQMCAVSYGSGALAGANVTNVTVLCVTKAWGSAQLIETNNAGDATSPEIALDGSGNAIAVWSQYDGVRYSIWANVYNAGNKAWGTAVVIETDDATQAYHPKIAIDGSGNAIVLWQRHDSVRYTILASRYDAGSGTWGAAMPVMSELGSAYGPNHNIAFDNSGNAIAVWSQSDGVRYSIWANRYSATSGTWGTAALIETDNTAPFGAFAPEIAIDPDGNGIAVWFQHDGTRNNIWANRYSAASATWGAAVLIETDNAGTAKNPEIAMDHSGNAIVVWYQSDGTRYNILANRYSTSSAAWGTAQLIETNDAGAGAYAYSPQIAMDGSGNALVVWYQYDSSMHNNIWANRYSTPSGTWGTAQLIETDNAGGAYNPQIAMDGNGNALAVWAQSDGTRNNISANRFNTASGTWGVVQLIGTDIARNAYPPRIAMDNSGNAVAVWFQYDNGTSYYSNIWANRYE